MAAKFRVVLHQGDVNNSIVDESFTAESVEQILQCKPDDVVHVDAVKVRDNGPESVSGEHVWLELCSMRDNLAEAAEMSMNQDAVTIEQMIVEGSMTAKQAMEMGYRWEAVVTGGDALAMRQQWLQVQAR